ncbi:hypothetical protein MHBO_004631 [Bonamia ostreae]|uniref:Uncharacterized protein n=1 Tax=Bonamia ostreae TaxID=126728 RepID=A0ABV2AUN2_9EUKA
MYSKRWLFTLNVFKTRLNYQRKILKMSCLNQSTLSANKNNDLDLSFEDKIKATRLRAIKLKLDRKNTESLKLWQEIIDVLEKRRSTSKIDRKLSKILGEAYCFRAHSKRLPAERAEDFEKAIRITKDIKGAVDLFKKELELKYAYVAYK